MASSVEDYIAKMSALEARVSSLERESQHHWELYESESKTKETYAGVHGENERLQEKLIEASMLLESRTRMIKVMIAALKEISIDSSRSDYIAQLTLEIIERDYGREIL